MIMQSKMLIGPRAGACSDDVAHFCTVIKPGEGRVYECLKTQREEEKMGNSDGTLPFSMISRSQIPRDCALVVFPQP